MKKPVVGWAGFWCRLKRVFGRPPSPLHFEEEASQPSESRAECLWAYEDDGGSGTRVRVAGLCRGCLLLLLLLLLCGMTRRKGRREERGESSGEGRERKRREGGGVMAA